MDTSMPADFWDRVARIVANLIFVAQQDASAQHDKMPEAQRRMNEAMQQNQNYAAECNKANVWQTDAQSQAFDAEMKAGMAAQKEAMLRRVHESKFVPTASLSARVQQSENRANVSQTVTGDDGQILPRLGFVY